MSMSALEKVFPRLLIRGDKARLIPVVSDGKLEERATSILLSNLSVIHELAERIFSAAGKRIGTRSQILSFTEVAFKEKSVKGSRPDGLVIVQTGKNLWTALVEAKIGNANLEEKQVKEYLDLAKKHKIDAVITISNQYSAIPSHHPLPLKPPKGVELYHWSWKFILTEAIILQKNKSVQDKEQRFLLDEMVRYYNHPKVGVSDFTQMNSEWKGLVSKVINGGKLLKNSDEVVQTVASWHQETRDICLMMSQELAKELDEPVSLNLSRKHLLKPEERLKDDCERLVLQNTLSCKLDIADAVSPLEVVVNIKSRNLQCSMRVVAPKDKQRGTARLNWLLKQLKDIKNDDENVDNILVKTITQGRSYTPLDKLVNIREDVKSYLSSDGGEVQPLAFDVILSVDMAGSFSGRKTFIEGVEKSVRDFYQVIGQKLQQPAAIPPKMSKSTEDTDDEVIDLPLADESGEEEVISEKQVAS